MRVVLHPVADVHRDEIARWFFSAKQAKAWAGPSEQAIVCGADLPGRSSALWAGSLVTFGHWLAGGRHGIQNAFLNSQSRAVVYLQPADNSPTLKRVALKDQIWLRTQQNGA
ncbi:MAG: hypothetical protein ETSY1_46565 (plasmid) [Candidatus Entotheonella factor]|uniref:Uncharacterized protein n=1 Tax=Entotheonella factor TaxID=1429438 RepID=W4M0F2_ENTF1|nr:MAG: hypothetical protein ETSY1_46565 [Candidatus Entotheonella factor]